MEHFVDFILVVGMVFTILTIISLLWRAKRELHHKIIGAIFILILIELLFFYAALNKVKWLVISTFVIEDSLIVLIGPLLLLYVHSLFEEPKKLKNKVVHFIPWLIYVFLVSLPALYYHLSDVILFDYLALLDSNIYILSLLIIVPMAYSILALSRLNKFTGAIHQTYSNLESRDLSWIRQMLLGIIAVCSIDLFTTILELSIGSFKWETGFITVAALAILTGYLAFYGISQSRVLVPEFLVNTENNDERIDNVRMPRKSSISHEIAIEIENNLLEILKEQQVYKDEDLTLSKLAALVPTTDKKLSTVLNQHMKTSFYEIINRYRIEAVKEMIKKGEFDHYTLLGIAQECGFRSKTSFNRVFKKLEGMSPSDFRKNIG